MGLLQNGNICILQQSFCTVKEQKACIAGAVCRYMFKK
jgi:hypothetical protein